MGQDCGIFRKIFPTVLIDKKTAPFWGAASLTGRKSQSHPLQKGCDTTHPRAESLIFRFRFWCVWAMTLRSGNIQKVIHV